MSENTNNTVTIEAPKKAKFVTFNGNIGTAHFKNAENITFDHSEFCTEAITFYLEYGICQFLSDKKAPGSAGRWTDDERRKVVLEYIELSKTSLPRIKGTRTKEPGVTVSAVEAMFLTWVQRDGMSAKEAERKYTELCKVDPSATFRSILQDAEEEYQANE